MTPELLCKRSNYNQWSMACGLIAGAMLAGGVAQAQIVAFDGFQQHDPASGIIGGSPLANDGDTMYGEGGPGTNPALPPAGHGWSTNWTKPIRIPALADATATHYHMIPFDSDYPTGNPPITITFTAPPAQIDGGSRGMRILGGSNGQVIKRGLTDNLSQATPTFWMGLLLRIGEDWNPAGDHTFSMIATTTAVADTDTLADSPGVGIRNGQFVSFPNAGTATPAIHPSISPVAGNDYWLICSFTRSGQSGSPYTASELWVAEVGSPQSDITGPAAATGSGTSRNFNLGQGHANSLRFISTGLSATDEIFVDSVVVGRTRQSILDGNTPLRVDLLSFAASADGAGSPVVLKWETAAEFDNAGFNVYRGANGAPGQKLNAFPISAQGSETEGATYSFVDSSPLARDEVRSYYLEDIEYSGVKTLHGPVRVGPFAGTRSSVDSWSLYN